MMGPLGGLELQGPEYFQPSQTSLGMMGRPLWPLHMSARATAVPMAQLELKGKMSPDFRERRDPPPRYLHALPSSVDNLDMLREAPGGQRPCSAVVHLPRRRLICPATGSPVPRGTGHARNSEPKLRRSLLSLGCC